MIDTIGFALGVGLVAALNPIRAFANPVDRVPNRPNPPLATSDRRVFDRFRQGQ